MLENYNDYRLLSTLLIQIRGIAGDAANFGRGHVSNMGRGHFTEQSALIAIYKLAEAAHNIPIAIVDPDAHFLLDNARKQVVAAGTEVFSDRSPFDQFAEPTMTRATSPTN